MYQTKKEREFYSQGRPDAKKLQETKVGMTAIFIAILLAILLQLMTCKQSIAQETYKPIGAFKIDSTKEKKVEGQFYLGHQVFLSKKGNFGYITIDKNGSQHWNKLAKKD